MKIVAAIFTVLFAIATLVGIGLLGANVIMKLFGEGGSYVQAMVGFGLTFGGSFLTQVTGKAVD